jgi:hypothetical protein
MFNSTLKNSGKNGLFLGGGLSRVSSSESQTIPIDRLPYPHRGGWANRGA